MKMKKLLGILLATIMVFSLFLTGCGTKEEKTETTTPTEGTKATEAPKAEEKDAVAEAPA
ncbi:MAG: hypothetical protein H6Q59_660 [Firmicutes bacterium]|nr:hypothetical protein [Bacillota bacterium]